MASKNDISFKIDEFNVKFNFRVAVLFERKDKILLQKSSKDDYYSLIGGRVKLFEDSKEALIRECEEEIGIELKRKQLNLIDVVENFFIYNNTKFHEILYIYKVTLDNNILAKEEFRTLDKDDCINKWFNKNQISELNIMPTIIKDIYVNNCINHHIIKDY